jgi:predicted transcriptional regulator
MSAERKKMYFLVSTINEPGGSRKRGMVASLGDIMHPDLGQSPSELLRSAENHYDKLVEKCKEIIAGRERIEDTDRFRIGEEIARFRAAVNDQDRNFDLEVYNLIEALAEDLKQNPATVQSYFLYYESHKDRAFSSDKRVSINDSIIEAFRRTNRAMTPTQISLESGVNYNTTRRVLQELASKKILVKGRARGTYLLSPSN